MSGGHPAADAGGHKGPNRAAREIGRGLAREVGLQRGAEHVLLFQERRQYLRAVQEALAGADAARVVLEGVVKRMEGG